MAEFKHQSMRVFCAALELDMLAYEVTSQIPRRNWALEQQLLRATASIVLNAAKGIGEFSAADKVRFYRYALRSSAEAAAAFDVLVRRKLVPVETAEAAIRKLEAIAGMLTNMIRAVRTRRVGRIGRAQPKHAAAKVRAHRHAQAEHGGAGTQSPSPSLSPFPESE